MTHPYETMDQQTRSKFIREIENMTAPDEIIKQFSEHNVTIELIHELIDGCDMTLFNKWWAKQSTIRRGLMLEDKWMMAQAAFTAGYNIGADEAILKLRG